MRRPLVDELFAEQEKDAQGTHYKEMQTVFVSLYRYLRAHRLFMQIRQAGKED